MTTRITAATRDTAPQFRLSTLALLPLAGLAMLLLGGCAIEVNDRDPGREAAYKPRTATDVCRREVERTYDDRFRIAYELPDLQTQGATQVVVQEFSLTPRKDYGTAIERRTVRCTVADGVLTAFTPMR